MGDPLRVKAIWAYEAAADEELSFFEDEIITVTSWDDGAWYYGEVEGRAGWFPSSYVEPATDAVDEPAAPAVAAAPVSIPVVAAKPSAGTAQTDAEKKLEAEKKERAALAVLLDTYVRQPKFGNDKALKELRAKIEDADKRIERLAAEVESARKPTAATGAAGKSANTYARALWEYKAAKSDELSMHEDDIVTIHSSDADGQWLYGSIGASSGWFPSSWVEAVDAADVTSVPAPEGDPPVAWDDEWDEVVEDGGSDDIYEALKTEWTAKRGSLGSDHYAQMAQLAAQAPESSAGAGDTQLAQTPSKASEAPALAVTLATARKWRKLVDEATRERLGKEEVHRQEAIFETYKTEEDYVRDLKTIIAVFIEPMRKQKVVSQKHLAVLFSNLEQLVPVNEELCNRLQRKSMENVVVDAVGDIFLILAEFLKVYTLYCGNYDSALVLFDKESKRNKAFKQFIDAAAQREECRGLNLLSYLIKPVQRICKYPLLLREILRHTTADKPDHQNLTKALNKIETVVAIVNEAGRVAENTKKMLDIQARLKTPDGEAPQLMTPSRRLVREDLFVEQMQSKREDRRLFLFNDLLLVTRPGKNKLHLISAIDMPACMVFDLDDEKDSLDAFEIVHVGRAKFTFLAPSPTAKKIWLDDLAEFTKEFMERQKEEWHAMEVPDGGDDIPLDESARQRVGSLRSTGDESPAEVRKSKADDGEDTSPPRRRHSLDNATVRSRKALFGMSTKKPARKDNSAPELAEIEESDEASAKRKEKEREERERKEREREERYRKEREERERKEREREEKRERERREREEREERERKERELVRREKEESRREREDRERREREEKEREKEARRLEKQEREERDRKERAEREARDRKEREEREARDREERREREEKEREERKERFEREREERREKYERDREERERMYRERRAEATATIYVSRSNMPPSEARSSLPPSDASASGNEAPEMERRRTSSEPIGTRPAVAPRPQGEYASRPQPPVPRPAAPVSSPAASATPAQVGGLSPAAAQGASPGPRRRSLLQQQDKYGPSNYRVTACEKLDKNYTYVIQIAAGGGSIEVRRKYNEFFRLHLALLEAFPAEAGSEGGARSIPFLPGQKLIVTDAVAQGRTKELDAYLQALMRMPAKISGCEMVKRFLDPFLAKFKEEVIGDESPAVPVAAERPAIAPRPVSSAGAPRLALRQQSDGDRVRAPPPRPPPPRAGDGASTPAPTPAPRPEEAKRDSAPKVTGDGAKREGGDSAKKEAAPAPPPASEGPKLSVVIPQRAPRPAALARPQQSPRAEEAPHSAPASPSPVHSAFAPARAPAVAQRPQPLSPRPSAVASDNASRAPISPRAPASAREEQVAAVAKADDGRPLSPRGGRVAEQAQMFQQGTASAPASEPLREKAPPPARPLAPRPNAAVKPATQPVSQVSHAVVQPAVAAAPAVTARPPWEAKRGVVVHTAADDHSETKPLWRARTVGTDASATPEPLAALKPAAAPQPAAAVRPARPSAPAALAQPVASTSSPPVQARPAFPARAVGVADAQLQRGRSAPDLLARPAPPTQQQPPAQQSHYGTVSRPAPFQRSPIAVDSPRTSEYGELDSDSFRMKVKTADDRIVAFNFRRGIAFAEVVDRVAQKLGARPASLKLKYCDEDGDHVLILGDDDLQMALSAGGGKAVILAFT